MEHAPILGIDIGGTSITAGIVVSNQIIRQYEVTTNARGNYRDVLDPLFSLIQDDASATFDYIGVAVPGFLDVKAGIVKKINNIPGLTNVPVSAYISEVLGKPVRIENDANCFVLGEYYFGEAGRYDHVIGITLGTGLGGGIIIDRKIYSGKLGGAGEFGLLPYLDGIAEQYCSGQFFLNHCKATGKKLFALAESGDPHALKCFDEFGKHLGLLLKYLSLCFAPQAMILGGTIAKAFDYFSPAIERHISTLYKNLGLDPPGIIRARQENAGLLGAAALWKQ
jgi:glucokinase